MPSRAPPAPCSSPAASGIVPALVGPEQLHQANGLSQVASAATRIAGPAIAAALIATVGPGWAIIADSVSFTASIVSLARLRIARLPRAPRSPWWAELRAGWAAFREQTWVWALTWAPWRPTSPTPSSS